MWRPPFPPLDERSIDLNSLYEPGELTLVDDLINNFIFHFSSGDRIVYVDLLLLARLLSLLFFHFHFSFHFLQLVPYSIEVLKPQVEFP